ncbi:hypothetical protein BDV06DRAFT_229292, partial [Aspergillus oleicola]
MKLNVILSLSVLSALTLASPVQKVDATGLQGLGSVIDYVTLGKRGAQNKEADIGYSSARDADADANALDVRGLPILKTKLAVLGAAAHGGHGGGKKEDEKEDDDKKDDDKKEDEKKDGDKDEGKKVDGYKAKGEGKINVSWSVQKGGEKKVDEGKKDDDKKDGYEKDDDKKDDDKKDDDEKDDDK